MCCSGVLSFFHLDAGLIFSMLAVPDKSGTNCYQTPKGVTLLIGTKIASITYYLKITRCL